MKRRPRYRRHRDTVAGHGLRRVAVHVVDWNGIRREVPGWEIVGTGLAVHREVVALVPRVAIGPGWTVTHLKWGYMFSP